MKPLFGPADTFDPGLISQHNPLMLRIDGRKIYLRIFDAYGSGQLREVEIIP